MGVGNYKNRVVLFYRPSKNKPFKIAISNKNGQNFKKIKEKIKLKPWKLFRRKEKEQKDFRLSQIKDKYILTYLEENNNHYQLKYRQSKDLINWAKPKEIPAVNKTGMVISNYQHQKNHFLVFGRKKITIAKFRNLSKKTTPINEYILKEQILGRNDLKVSQIFNHKQGILVLCYRYQDLNVWGSYSWQLVLLDEKEPQNILWSKNFPIPGEIPNQNPKTVYPLGAVRLKNKLISYWQINRSEIISLSQPFFEIEDKKPSSPFPYLDKLTRSSKNPILRPTPENSWESKLAFNPAAVKAKDKIHLIYRAVGETDVSVFGYASTKDGINIDQRLKSPVYEPRKGFEINPEPSVTTYQSYSSGWGAGGCEDPKLTKIGNRIYMTYTAWNGSDPPGVALTSIDVDDFINHRWDWKLPVLISPPNEIHKNWVIFPEKINGRYAILHSLSPRILIDYVDNLNFDGKTFLESHYEPSGRKNYWDTWVRGTGPPPVKTDDGWLLFYHAMDNKDPGRYKLGGMVLDHLDPTQILYRTNSPLLEPNMNYENEGFKSGVVYACGAVVKKDRLFVYYGGADTVSCVAHTKLNKLLSQMKKHQDATFQISNLPS